MPNFEQLGERSFEPMDQLLDLYGKLDEKDEDYEQKKNDLVNRMKASVHSTNEGYNQDEMVPSEKVEAVLSQADEEERKMDRTNEEVIIESVKTVEEAEKLIEEHQGFKESVLALLNEELAKENTDEEIDQAIERTRSELEELDHILELLLERRDELSK